MLVPRVRNEADQVAPGGRPCPAPPPALPRSCRRWLVASRARRRSAPRVDGDRRWRAKGLRHAAGTRQSVVSDKETRIKSYDMILDYSRAILEGANRDAVEVRA